MENNPWKKIKSTTVYRNDWIQVEHQDVVRPDNKPGVYGIVHFTHRALGVVVLDHAMNTILVGQYRYPLQQYSWEIPEGGGAMDEEPLAAIQRELLEETGLTAGEWIDLGKVCTSNCVCDEWGQVWLARQLKQGEACPEGTEVLQTKWIPFAQAVQQAVNGQIFDSVSVVGLLRAKHYLENEKTDS